MLNHLFCGSSESNSLAGAQISALLISMQRVGTTSGAILAAFLPNLFGRKRSMQFTIVLNFVFLITLIFANHPAMYAVCLALCEACSGFIITVVSAYGIEVIGPKWRIYFGAVGTVAYSLGFILVTLLAMYLPDRQVLTTAMASIYALNLLYIYAIPESPIWALTTNRFKTARVSISSLSSTLTEGGQSQVDQYIENLSRSFQRRSSSACDLPEHQNWRWKVANSSMGRLFKGKLIKKFTLLTLVMHTCVSVADVGSKYYVSKLPGNIYFNSCFTGLAELIGSLVTFPLVRRFGLKKTSMGLNLAAGCFMLLAMGLLQLKSNAATIGVYMSFAAKVLNIGGWSTQVTYIANLLPSDVRSSGIALVRIGSVCTLLAPLIITVKLDWLPLTVFGVLSLLSGGIQWFLPDLAGVPMFLFVEDQERYFSKV